jgi:hypothetical protein
LTAPFIYEMYVQGGELKGISSNFAPPVTSFLPIAMLGGTVPVWWHLEFQKEVSPVGTPSVQLYWTKAFENPSCIASSTCVGGGGGASENKAILAVVPEPSTYALMVGGLIAVGAVARRRKQ